MDNLTKFLSLFPAGDVDAIRKEAERMAVERRDRLNAYASSHRFDLIGQEAKDAQRYVPYPDVVPAGSWAFKGAP